MRSVVVTGSSTGIGWGTAKVLIARGFRVFGSVRRAEDAERLRREFGPAFVPLQFDVTEESAVRRAADQVSAELASATLAGLVNNAGVAFPGPLLYLPIQEFRQQVEINLTGQLIVTQAFGPLLGADSARVGPPGRIVMMSSVGGRNGSPFLGPYNASKFGLEGLAESLRRELMIFGIDVVVIAPGAVVTPIWDKAEALDERPYASTPYAEALAAVKTFAIEQGRHGFPPETVGRVVHKALTVSRPRWRYTVTPDPFMFRLAMALPKRLLDRIVARRLGFTRRGVAKHLPRQR
jgi:NAD(P)-dependent dehydrogenase (short-subunit alcohol dehydrogenase family)